MSAFEVVCEIEPATKPDLTRVRHQIGVLTPIATRFLIPDNHIGLTREFADEHRRPIRIGVSCGLGPVPAWKQHADAWCVQVSYAIDTLLRWRSDVDFGGAVYAGVMALPSATMARKLSTDVPQLAVPAGIVDRLEADPTAGVDLAVELVTEVRDSAAFGGVHLIPVNRYRQVAAALEPVLT